MKYLLAALVVLIIGSVPVLGQSEPSAPLKSVRKFRKSFQGQDLSKQSFVKQNLDDCDFEDADLSGADFSNCSLKNCNFRGANLTSITLSYADLTGSDFRESQFKYAMLFRAVLNQVNLEGLDLSTIQLNELKLRGANLRNVKDIGAIYKSDFYEADVRGANFTNASDYDPATFRKAKYDQHTRWHKGFDPKSRGAVYLETKAEEVEKESDNSPMPSEESRVVPSKVRAEDKFNSLDRNQDGVLSGNEIGSYAKRDKDGDGEISLEEFEGSSSPAVIPPIP